MPGCEMTVTVAYLDELIQIPAVLQTEILRKVQAVLADSIQATRPGTKNGLGLLCTQDGIQTCISQATYRHNHETHVSSWK